MSASIKSQNVTSINLVQAMRVCDLARRGEVVDQHKNRLIPLILGAPGQGKSSIVEQYVEKLNADLAVEIANWMTSNPGKTEDDAHAELGAYWTLVSYRLGQCDPTDLKGVPVYIEVDGKQMCSFAPPQIFPMVGIPQSANGRRVVIFLDELPQAIPTIQNLAANIIDGRVGDYQIDMTRTLIVAAGNRKDDKAATFDLPRNVLNRVSILDVKTSFGEWKEWAISANVHPYVIGYLENRQQSFNMSPPELPNQGYATPRSWHKVSSVLKASNSSKGIQVKSDDFAILQAFTQGSVGTAIATDFINFCRTMAEKYSIQDIFDGKGPKLVTSETRDIAFSLILEATYRVNSWHEELMSDPDYVKAINSSTKPEVRSAAYLTFMKKDKRLTSIKNLYEWIVNSGVDIAYQVLINKYQTQKTRDHLRTNMLQLDEFKDVVTNYMKINAMIKG